MDISPITAPKNTPEIPPLINTTEKNKAVYPHHLPSPCSFPFPPPPLSFYILIIPLLPPSILSPNYKWLLIFLLL